MKKERKPGAAPDTQEARNTVIVRASVFGIIGNVVLAALKALLGVAAHSMAMVMDAVNSLSDALACVITLAGTKLSAKKPDKRHPLGYGRVEYLSSMIIAVLVLNAGITALVRSIKGILNPVTPEYSVWALVVIAVSIAGKLVLGRYLKRTGKQAESGALTAAAEEAMHDSLLSAAVLACALLFLLTGINLEAWVSVVISAFIIKSGIEMVLESGGDILGGRFDSELMRSIRQTVREDDEVLGAYDLILHSYGANRLLGSIHVAVAASMTAPQISRMSRRITERVLAKHGVILEGISVIASDPAYDDMRDQIIQILLRHDGIVNVHGFYADEERKLAGFDLVLDYGMKNRQEVYHAICEEVSAAFPDYPMQINADVDF